VKQRETTITTATTLTTAADEGAGAKSGCWAQQGPQCAATTTANANNKLSLRRNLKCVCKWRFSHNEDGRQQWWDGKMCSIYTHAHKTTINTNTCTKSLSVAGRIER